MAMAPTLLHLPHQRSGTPPIDATSNDGILPIDLTQEILQRLPTEPICRFRAVCRSWRSMLSHPDFIAAARNPGPLLAAAVLENFSKVLDTESGDEVKQVDFAAADGGSSCCSLDSKSHERAVCVVGKDRRQISLLDPATGAISVLPDHTQLEGATTWCTIGRSASTGEHKVLTIAATSTMSSEAEACKILTLSCTDHVWRETASAPMKAARTRTGFPVVNGVAYMLGCLRAGSEFSHRIMEFDLDREAWRPATIRTPVILFGLNLCELQGHLVVACDNRSTAIDIWFLVDSQRSTWSKRYTITMPHHHHNPLSYHVYFEKPLAILDDGRIVMWMRVASMNIHVHDDTFLRIYDPRTETFSDGTIIPSCNRATVFTWSLLHTGHEGALDTVARQALIRRRHQ
ncbi:F-box/kelch-repeat protein At3g23880-like [Lolium perenne]|uniref:F-box/kelch-repeat protein At3g23880-like n=1 Tax=Lolium perenne TaxID=4522 RepID=UPI003A9A6303